MVRGKFKKKPTGRRHFSTPAEMRAGISSLRPHTFKRGVAEERREEKEEESKEEKGEDSEGVAEERREEKEEESKEEKGEDSEKRKGTQGVIEIENPNLVKPNNVKAKGVDIWKTTELSRRERKEIEKQESHERYMRLREQGKTEQARKDLERLALIRQERAEAPKKREEEKAECLALIRQERAEAAKKREEEKAAKGQKKAEALK